MTDNNVIEDFEERISNLEYDIRKINEALILIASSLLDMRKLGDFDAGKIEAWLMSER